MECTQLATESGDRRRPLGRFSRWLPLTLAAGLSLAATVVGARWSCGSHPDELTGQVTGRDAGNITSDASLKTLAKQTTPLALPLEKQVALRGNDKTESRKPRDNALATPSTRPDDRSPIARALDVIAECQARYRTVSDYTCTFFKRERVNGRLTGLHVMTMKVRRHPGSIYVKFQQPGTGREAIYIAGRNGGKVLAHDVGLNKLLAGTLLLDPTSARAMEDNRHPITEAGIGPLLETLATRWALELDPNEAVVVFRDDALVGQQHCNVVEVTHPHRHHRYLHHKVRVYVDKSLGVPIRFEAYDWPKKADVPGELTEEYTYTQLRLNVGLREIDFDTANPAYSFGRL